MSSWISIYILSGKRVQKGSVPTRIMNSRNNLKTTFCMILHLPMGILNVKLVTWVLWPNISGKTYVVEPNLENRVNILKTMRIRTGNILVYVGLIQSF